MPDRRRFESAALFAPLFGAALLVPPVLSIFNVRAALFGVPLVVVYLFAVWAALVIVTVALSRRLTGTQDPQGPDGPGEDGG